MYHVDFTNITSGPQRNQAQFNRRFNIQRLARELFFATIILQECQPPSTKRALPLSTAAVDANVSA